MSKPTVAASQIPKKKFTLNLVSINQSAGGRHLSPAHWGEVGRCWHFPPECNLAERVSNITRRARREAEIAQIAGQILGMLPGTKAKRSEVPGF
jgi:hypothetical protein